MSIQTAQEDLYNINRRFISDDPSNNFPAVTLPDGTRVQTGTVGALIQNIKIYDEIDAGREVDGLTKDRVEHMLNIPLPTLKKVGMFDIFPPIDWMSGSSEGRKIVGRKAAEMGY